MPGRSAPAQCGGPTRRASLWLRGPVPTPFAVVVVTVLLCGLVITGRLLAEQGRPTYLRWAPAAAGAALNYGADTWGSGS